MQVILIKLSKRISSPNSIILRGNISDTTKEKAKRGNLFTERQGVDDYIIS